MDRRALFFLGAALVCFALAPIGLAEYQHVAVIVGCVYVLYAVLSFLDARTRIRRRRR
jgi:UDP-N-acetylmuramyl pentapeptide phosphotransferase/UDP-N-acetylglucosamine-1-phosphate transferase